jgi:putative SOS response-associated peptidase YedK
MCGRYSITIDKSAIEYHFNAKFVSGAQEFHPTYNAAPSQLLPIITTDKVSLRSSSLGGVSSQSTGIARRSGRKIMRVMTMGP